MAHKYLKIGMLVLLVTCVFMGCVGEQNAKADDGRITFYNAGNLIIYHDNVNNVTIYDTIHGSSSIPDWMLTASENVTE